MKVQEAVHVAHVAPWKKDEVKRLQELMRSKPITALIGIGGIPSPQMLTMRAMLREHGEMRSGKNNLFKLAIEGMAEERPEITQLLDHMEGQAAILATDVNPFKLFKQMENTKQMMPAKGGDIAPNDITVQKGETPFPPGPIVGELQQAGIPAAIEQGKVVVKKTTTVVKEGEEISTALAQGLAKLEIFPIEVGLQLLGVWEDGFVFQGDDLKIDEVAFGSDLVRAIQSGVNLGVNAPVYTADLAPLVIMKAHREALNLAVEAGVLNDATAPLILGKATRQALAIAGACSAEALDEDINAMLSAAAAAPVAAAPAAGDGGGEAAAEEEEEEEEVSEEEAAEGLGALFG